MEKQKIQRSTLEAQVVSRLLNNPVALLLGPRQCGKTTLARQIAGAVADGRLSLDMGKETAVTFFDLENPVDQQRLSQPMTALERLRGLVVIDEAQLQPSLFPVLRVLADRDPLPAHFLLLGSASPNLIRGSSESLAGRVALIPMSGFSLTEVCTAGTEYKHKEMLRKLWWRGGFPRSFLAPNDDASRAWRNDFIATFIERDLRIFGAQMPPNEMRRFWNMTTHYHGQLWNASEIGRALGHAHTTVKRYLDVFCEGYVLRQLQPWFENIANRQVKTPKVYFRDSGLLHNLLGTTSFETLECHPKIGASWEGFAIEEIARLAGERNIFFWASPTVGELDLLVLWNGKRIGFEFKYADAPMLTKSMKLARETLRLDKLFVVYPGNASYLLSDGNSVVCPLPEALKVFSDNGSSNNG